MMREEPHPQDPEDPLRGVEGRVDDGVDQHPHPQHEGEDAEADARADEGEHEGRNGDAVSGRVEVLKDLHEGRFFPRGSFSSLPPQRRNQETEHRDSLCSIAAIQ